MWIHIQRHRIVLHSRLGRFAVQSNRTSSTSSSAIEPNFIHRYIFHQSLLLPSTSSSSLLPSSSSSSIFFLLSAQLPLLLGLIFGNMTCRGWSCVVVDSSSFWLFPVEGPVCTIRPLLYATGSQHLLPTASPQPNFLDSPPPPRFRPPPPFLFYPVFPCLPFPPVSPRFSLILATKAPNPVWRWRTWRLANSCNVTR